MLTAYLICLTFVYGYSSHSNPTYPPATDFFILDKILIKAYNCRPNQLTILSCGMFKVYTKYLQTICQFSRTDMELPNY